MDRLKYTVQISWSPADDCYLALVPELPGCVTEGESYAEAAENAQEAIESYLAALKAEGRAIPIPLAEQEFSGKLNLRLGSELHRDVAAKAQMEGKSINDLLLEAAEVVVYRPTKQSSKKSRSSVPSKQSKQTKKRAQ